MLYVSPGRVMPLKTAEWAVENLKNLETAFVGYGIHFIQEDNPEAVGRAIAEWYRRLSVKEASVQMDVSLSAQEIIDTVKHEVSDPTAPFTLLVQIKAKPGEGKTVATAYGKVIEATLREPGCIAYDFNRDPSDPTRFVLYERWKNLDSLARHFEAPYTRELFGTVAPLYYGPRQLQVLEYAGELDS